MLLKVAVAAVHCGYLGIVARTAGSGKGSVALKGEGKSQLDRALNVSLSGWRGLVTISWE